MMKKDIIRREKRRRRINALRLNKAVTLSLNQNKVGYTLPKRNAVWSHIPANIR